MYIFICFVLYYIFILISYFLLLSQLGWIELRDNSGNGVLENFAIGIGLE